MANYCGYYSSYYYNIFEEYFKRTDTATLILRPPDIMSESLCVWLVFFLGQP